MIFSKRIRVGFSSILLFWVAQQGALGQPFSSTEREILKYVESHKEDAILFLEKLVNINSGTMNHAGVKKVGQIFQTELSTLGFISRWIPMTSVNRAGHLFAERKGKQGNRLLLIGHLDTVFEKNNSFQKFNRHGSIGNGPGVQDMKGGDTVILYALKALHEVNALTSTNIIIALIGDEENTGDPISVSRRDLIAAAHRSDIALAFEGATESMNNAVVARRGSSDWLLRVTGMPGHSSQIFTKKYGTGAIYEAARILTGFYKLLGEEQYLTLSPGLILGGSVVEHNSIHSRGSAFGKNNVIPKTAVLTGDLRFISQEQRDQAKNNMRSIVTQNLSRVKATITFSDSYPAMSPTPGNYQLLTLLDKISHDLGQGRVDPVDPGQRGAADISFVAPHVQSSLDGLGIAGSGSHTINETVNLDSLSQSIKRAALLIYRLTRDNK